MRWSGLYRGTRIAGEGGEMGHDVRTGDRACRYHDMGQLRKSMCQAAKLVHWCGWTLRGGIACHRDPFRCDARDLARGEWEVSLIEGHLLSLRAEGKPDQFSYEGVRVCLWGPGDV